MKRTPLYIILTLLVLVVLVSACGPKASNTNEAANNDANANAAHDEDNANHENDDNNEAHNNDNNDDLEDQPVEEPEEEPVEEPTEEPGFSFTGTLNLVEYTTSDEVVSFNYPEGMPTNEVTFPDGVSFGVAEKPEYFTGTMPDFTVPTIMVYGSTKQVPAELAVVEQLGYFHESSFYTGEPPFIHVMNGDPQVLTPSPYLTWMVSESSTTMPDGSVVYWKLATGLADLTVVTYAVGMSQVGMEQLGQTALDIFNSVEVDTLVTEQLAQ